MTKPKMYIAGPMRGIKHYNFAEFDAARDRINRGGDFEALSPADMDRAIGFDPFKLPDDFDWNTIPPEFDLDSCIERDTNAIRECKAIYMLKGWDNSTGATAEYHLSRWRKMQVFFEVEPAKTACEIRVVNPITGGQKGQKLCRMDLLPWDSVWEVAEHYGRGSKKYSDHNWAKGYNWSLSIGALFRHAALFATGENVDAETGSNHMAAVAFHALALLRFCREHPELDDRYRTSDPKGGS